MKITAEIAQKVIETVDAGLCLGAGRPEPGKMCVEAAVCFALGLPHGDQPTCVGGAVRAFKIGLNDSRWSSDKARARGLRKIAVAQLGSDTIDQVAFARLVSLKIIQKVVPMRLRAAGMKGNQKYKLELEECANLCERATNLEDAKKMAEKARTVARNADNAAADAAYAAYADYASNADYSAANAAANDAANAAAAAAYADYSAALAAANADKVLCAAAECALEALIELKSPGCQWLNLCEKAAN
jgi:hypothetical protein